MKMATQFDFAIFVEQTSQVHLANHRRENVAVDEVEIVVRPIEVGGHHGNVVSAILQIEALAEF